MTSIVLPSATGIDLTAPPTNIGTVTPPAITVSTLFRSANSGNVPFVAQPSGTGAFQLQQTDNTATGGNARGSNAIDLQTVRTLASQVANGAASIVIGQENTANGANSLSVGVGNSANANGIAIGTGNSANSSSYALGLGNNASGIFSIAFGFTSTSSGNYATSIGFSNAASGSYSVALGTLASTKQVSSLLALGNLFDTLGKAQTNILALAIQSSDSTPTVLKSDTGVASASNQLVLQNNSALYVEGLVIATTTGAGDTSSWKISATIKRGANATSTVLVGTPTITMIHQDAGASAWAVAVTANTTLGCLAVTVTGQSATTIRWVCTLFASEVAF